MHVNFLGRFGRNRHELRARGENLEFADNDRHRDGLKDQAGWLSISSAPIPPNSSAGLVNFAQPTKTPATTR